MPEHQGSAIVGDAIETVGTLYPYDRPMEAGFAPVAAGAVYHFVRSSPLD